MDLSGIGKIVITFGAILLLTGIVMVFLSKYSLLTKLPGDIYFKKGNFSFYFPIGISIILSIVLTVILNMLLRWK